MQTPSAHDGTVRRLAEAFRDVAAARGDAACIATPERTLGFAELAERAGGIAAALRDRTPHGTVVLLPRDAMEFVAGALGSLAAGRSYSVADPSRSSAAIRALAERVGATAIVGVPDGGHGPSAPWHLPWTVPPAPYEPSGTDGLDITSYAMTSGSTAEPKVIATRATFYLDLLTGPPDVAEPGPDDLLMGAFAYIGVGLHLPLAAALFGRPLWSFDPNRLAPSAVLSGAAAFGATYWLTVPSMLRRLLSATRRGGPVPRLRMLATSGEALHGQDVRAIRDLLGPSVTIVQRYGATEVGSIARLVLGPGESAPDGPLPAGRPRDGLSVTIVDDDERPVPPGTVGRIRVEGRLSGAGIAATAVGGGRERFVLGDLGTIEADGLLRIVGRQDRMVKVGGVRIEPGAVEDVLRTVAGVREVAVVPVPIRGGEHRLVAHVVVDDPATVTATALRAAATASLTSMAVPARFVIGTEPLPLLPNGKLDRRALAELGPAASEG